MICIQKAMAAIGWNEVTRVAQWGKKVRTKRKGEKDMEERKNGQG